MHVPRNRPYPDEEAFGFQEIMALIVAATSILFITKGAKLHKFLKEQNKLFSGYIKATTEVSQN